MSFTLENGSTNQSFEAWGIGQITITERSQAVGEMRLTVRTVDANASPVFAYKSKITIWQGATKRFVGWVTSLPVFASNNTEYHSYTVSDAWWWLEQITFQDVSGPFYAEADTEGATPQWPYCSMVTIGNSGLVLNVGGTWTTKSIGSVIYDAALYASYCGAPIGTAYVTIGSYGFLEDARDLSCADLIRRALNWSPTAATWWTYTHTSPDLHCDTRSNLTDVSIELGGAIAQSWELVPRYDIKLDYVMLYIMRERQRTDGTVFKTLSREGSAPGWPGAGGLIASIVMGTDEAGNEEAVPAGVASRLLSELSSLQWEGKIECVESECSFIARPGNTLNFTGAKAHASWATMHATVQQVEYNLVTGRTVITFGPPSHLSPQDMIALLNAAKKGRPAPNPPNPGGGPGGGGLGGGKPAQPYELELCDGTMINVLLASPVTP